MNPSELAEDGVVVLHALSAPARGVTRIAARRRSGVALAVATAAALATAAVVVPRIDYAAAAGPRIEASGSDGQAPTPFEREQAAATARKLGQIAGWSAAALLPAVFALAAAAALFVGFRVAGTRPAYRATLAVTAHGMLPVWLSGLLVIPAAIAKAPLVPAQLERLVPTSLAALAPHAPPALAAALGALGLFQLWALGLVGVGMARAAACSRTRAVVVTTVLFLAYVALFKVVPAAAVAGGPH